MGPLFDNLREWLPLIGGMLFLARAGRNYLDDWRAAGPVLVDLGGFPLARFAGGLFCASLLYLGFRWLRSPIGWLGLGLLISLVSVAALARVQFCENGVWHGFGLVNWFAISGHRWQGHAKLVLEGPVDWSLPITVSVPRKALPGVKEVLQEKTLRAGFAAADDPLMADGDLDDEVSFDAR